jgi:16S rRNA (uracil1498-N3)-methyltransferase
VSKPLRVPLEGLSPGMRLLTGAVARYVSRVHRRGPGDRLLLFDPAGGMEAEALLGEGDAGGVYCEVGDVRPSGYRPYPICLMQGLGKAEKPDLVIRDATALGVGALVLVATERTVARVSAERGGARLDRWRRIAIEAARQSGRGNLPSILGPLLLPEALAEVSEVRRIMLTPGATPLFEQLRGWHAAESLALLVGPEGGLSASEARLAQDAGFSPASLGGTTLRTELAGVAALGALVALSAARALG